MALKKPPIQRKLVRLVFITSFSVLLVSFLVVLAYEMSSSKHTTQRNLATIGEIIASNSSTALLYDNEKVAREILLDVRAEPDITAAALFDKSGKLYASYSVQDPAEIPAIPRADGSYFSFSDLTLFRPVMEGDARVGTLFLRSNLRDMYRRLSVYGTMLLGVLAGSGVFAYFLSSFLQRQISRPILALADAARVVSEQKDYSKRAIKTSDDELGFLTDSFNSMLEQIQLNLAALQESDQRFRLVADSAPVLIWLSDTEENCIWFNKHWLEFVGRSLSEEVGQAWMGSLHPEDRQRSQLVFTEAFRTRREFRIEYRLRRHDGEYRWVLDHGVPRYQGAEFAGFIGSCVDIHDRKEAEAAVRTSELQMRLVTDHASVMLCQLDRQHRFKFVNRGYAERYGREPAEILGKHISEIVGADAYAVFKERIDSALAGKREDFEVEAPYTLLGRRWVHLVCVPERDLDGRVMGLVAVLTDTTRRRQAEKELERVRDEALAASRAKDDFLAALSHELRTPLSPVLLLASESATNEELPAVVRADFETIRKNVELEARLIDDLLDLTSITRGKLVIELRPVDVHVVLRDAIATVRAEIDAKQLVFTTNFAREKITVLGDPVRLQQVFWNVLKNAVKFTPAGGKISVETRAMENDKLVLSVTDSGIGMSSEELARVFEAFAQGEHAGSGGSHRFGGLGLGLAISRKVVELHSGRINAASGGRDLGCTFSIELPMVHSGESDRPADDGAIGLSANPFARAPGDRGTILLVEDHAPTRSTVEQLLKRRRYHVVSAASVAEARAAAEKQKIDLVISDIGLPDGTGYELMADLRQRFGLKGIALTGYGMEGDITQSQVAGFLIHLIKPVRVQSLDDALLMSAQWPQQSL